MAADTQPELTSALIRYFRDCLLADGGERELNDLLANGEREHRILPLDDTSSTGIPPAVELAGEEGERLSASLQLKRQELRPLIGAYILTGRTSANTQNRIRTPLFVMQAQIVRHDSGFRISCNPESLRINAAALDALELPQEWQQQALPESEQFASLLEQIAALPTTPVPKLAQELSIPRNGQLHVARCALFWLSRRSHTASSIAFELEAMAQAEDHSACLKQLLGTRQEAAAGPAPIPESLPNRLSHTQEQTLQNACREVLSVIHGAPGTGKTYTIAGIATDRVMRGERVLIACGNDHAADVVYDQLGNSFFSGLQMVVRAGLGDYRQQLLQQLDDLLAMRSDKLESDPETLADKLRKGVDQQRSLVNRFHSRLQRSERVGDSLSSGTKGLFQSLKIYWSAWITRRSSLLAQNWAEYHQQVDNHRKLARDLLSATARKRHFRLLRQHRKDLAGLASALRARSSGNRSKRMDSIDWEMLTQAFPVWIVSTQSVYRSLPLEKELFDLVIMDEATQCNLAQGLPALQRGRRAVIVGDAKQLRHFSFLARARQAAFAQAQEVENAAISLDYRERSLLDYAIESLPHADAQVWLDEHFRSHPQLISFSNHHFYDNRLKILTDTQRVTAQPPRQIVNCPVRIEDDINQGEVDTLLDFLTRVTTKSAELPDAEIPSIGVLCFFSQTAKVLEQRILAEFDLATLSRHNLLVATPYGFQGNERDLMLISSGIYPGRSHAARSYMERADVFNVAVTRARTRQIIFISEGYEKSTRRGLLTSYLQHNPSTSAPERPLDAHHDRARQELMTTLEGMDAKCWTDFPVGGQQVDLLVVRGETVLAIDLIGCPAPFGEAWSADRYNLLARAGLKLIPVSYAEWLWRRQDVLDNLKQLLQSDTRDAVASSPAGRIEHLRWTLERLDAQQQLTILNDLEQSLTQLKIWLGRRFTVGELSYRRYHEGIDRLATSALTELSGIALLLEESQALAIDSEDLAARIKTPTDNSRSAATSLLKMAQKLALMESPSGIDDSLREITELNKRLASYHGLLKNPGDGADSASE
jgi:hypothetical protein